VAARTGRKQQILWEVGDVTAASPLEGIRVLDVTTYLAGPFATRVLADLGATVLKVEPPTGDVTRAGWRSGDEAGGPNDYWRAIHGGRRSVAIDLADPAGRDRLISLAAEADVAVDNMRPGVTARFGVDGPSLRARFPRLITCAISGFDPGDPLATISATDGPIQAWAGSVDLMQRWCGVALPMPLQAGDIAGGSAAAQGVLAALFERTRTGVGRHIQVSLAGALDQWLAMTDRRLTLRPPATLVLRGSDGERFLVQTPLRFAAALLHAMGLPADLPRDEIGDACARVVAGDVAQAWLDRLWAAGIPAALVRPLERPDEQLPLPPWTFDGERPQRAGPPPELGADDARGWA
jgi:crotonobetainyl-CoA:carnitine CoA-transferase CaiB-like acyl-CoA transferase